MERFEVEEFVDAGRVSDVHEERHAEDSVDEHDKEEQETNVEESREGHGQWEQQRPDALGRLDQSQNSSDTKHTDDS